MSEVFPKKKITHKLIFVNMKVEIIVGIIVAVVVSQIVGVLYRRHKRKEED